MEPINLNGNGRISVRTEIEVPHAEEIITHALPLVGPGNYQKVMGKISKEGLLRPTTGQTLSLVNLALQNPEEEYCQTILGKFKDNYFWTSTENLWGKEDVIVYDNIDGNMPSDRDSLIKRFKDGDKAIRVVKYGFKTGSQSVSELVKNPYIVAQVGNLPLDVVAEIAKRIISFRPSILALGSQNRDTKRYTAVNSQQYVGSFGVYGIYGGISGNGSASGVCRSAEGTV